MRSGPRSTPDASTRSALRADSMRANTASVMPVTGTPSSSAEETVQRPVPFCSASSRITSTSGLPLASSTLASTLAVVSIRNDSRSPWFQLANTPASSAGRSPSACPSRSYASAMSCMSAYSMPLWTIFTKCPAPSGPTWVQHGTPSTLDALDSRVALLGAARHDARAVERALLAAGDTGADEVQAALGEGALPPAGVLEPGVAAVDQHVARFQEGGELVDHGVDRGAGLDHDQDPPRPGQRLDQLGGRGGAADRPLPAVAGQQLVGAGGRAVVDHDRDAVAGDVAGEVLAHHGQAGESELGGASQRLRLLEVVGRTEPARRMVVPARRAAPVQRLATNRVCRPRATGPSRSWMVDSAKPPPTPSTVVRATRQTHSPTGSRWRWTVRSGLTNTKRRQSSTALTPLPESAAISTRVSGEGSSPGSSGWRMRIQTVAGPGSRNDPLTKRHSMAVW